MLALERAFISRAGRVGQRAQRPPDRRPVGGQGRDLRDELGIGRSTDDPAEQGQQV